MAAPESQDDHGLADGVGEDSGGRRLAKRRARSGWRTVCRGGAKPGDDGRGGNVLGWLPAAKLPPESTGPLVVLSAHLDTVFPAETPLKPVVGRGCAGSSRSLRQLRGGSGDAGDCPCSGREQSRTGCAAAVSGQCGARKAKETCGECDISTNRPRWQAESPHTSFWTAAGEDMVVTQALGSRRFQVAISGPGGPQLYRCGTVNPIVALAAALAVVAQTELPEEPRTTLNLGTIQGGTSVNSIPENAQASIDFRSTNSEQLVRLEVALHRAVEDAVDRCNAAAKAGRRRGQLTYTIKKIGDRPAAGLASDSPLLESAARRGPASRDRERSSARLDRRQYSAVDGGPALSMGAGGDEAGCIR